MDEAQELAYGGNVSLAASLRTELEEHRKNVNVVFTGSSREA